MNERIRELATEVGMSVEYLESTKQIVLIERFAELIVRDVLDEVLQAIDDGMDVYDTVADKFGVEE